MKRHITLQPQIELCITAEKMGRDLAITITGGNRPHIGSVSIAIPRASLTGSGKMSATTSVFNVTGHKDDVVGTKVAGMLAAQFNNIVTVSCGIHFDNITSAQMEAVLQAPEIILQEILNWFRGAEDSNEQG